jgi:hypothetical protein
VGRGRRVAWRLAITSVLLTCGASVQAHPPYESPVTTLRAPDGSPVSVVKRYTDGLFFTDPVQVLLRDGQGGTLAESDAGRDVSVVCLTEQRCIAFRYDGLMPVIPEDVWRIEGRTVQKVDSLVLTAVGVVVPLWDHWLGYLIAVLLLVIPWAALKRSWARPATPANGCVVAVVGLSAAGLWILWLYGVVLLSYLSLPLVAAVTISLAFAWRRIRATLRGRNAPLATTAVE